MKKISQSFMLDMVEYTNGGGCGHLMREKWVKDRLLELDSKAAKLGCYFEYIFTLTMTGTGSLPKGGKIPRASYMAMPLKKLPKAKNPWDEMIPGGQTFLGVDDMYADYRLAHINSERLQGYFKLMGIKIISAGRKFTKGKYEGTIDLICEATKRIEWANGDVWEIGFQFVMDLKYSGLIDDRWNKYGWAGLFFAGDNEQKRVHFTQARQYNFVTDLPFYFMVVSSVNDLDIKFFKVVITEEESEIHLMQANDLEEKLHFYEKLGWEPRPDISKCGECPLSGTCKDKATYPQIETVKL